MMIVNPSSHEELYQNLTYINKALVIRNRGGMVDANLSPTTTNGAALSDDKIIEIMWQMLSKSFLLNENKDSRNIINLLRFSTKKFISNQQHKDGIKNIGPWETVNSIDAPFEFAWQVVYNPFRKIFHSSADKDKLAAQNIEKFMSTSAEELCMNHGELVMDAFALLQNFIYERECFRRTRDFAVATIDCCEAASISGKIGKLGELVQSNQKNDNYFKINIHEEVLKRVPAKLVPLEMRRQYLMCEIASKGESKKLNANLDKVVRKLIRAKHQMPEAADVIEWVLSEMNLSDYVAGYVRCRKERDVCHKGLGQIYQELACGNIGQEMGVCCFIDLYPLIEDWRRIPEQDFERGLADSEHRNPEAKWMSIANEIHAIAGLRRSTLQRKIDMYGALYNKIRSIIDILTKNKKIRNSTSLRVSMVFKKPFSMVCKGDIPHPDVFASTDELGHAEPFKTRAMLVMEKMRLEEEENIELQKKSVLWKEKEKIGEQDDNNRIVLEKKLSELAINDEVVIVSENSTSSVDILPVVEVAVEPVIQYASRVGRWFSKNAMNIFAEDRTYVGGNFSEQAKARIILNHNFGLAIDEYITQYGLETKYTSKKKTADRQFSLAGEIEKDGKIQRGIFTLTFDKNTNEVYHRFFTQRATSEIIDEFVTKRYYDADFPELGSVKNEKRRWDDTERQEYEMNRNDGSHVLGFEDNVVEVADPKNDAVLRGFAVKH